MGKNNNNNTKIVLAELKKDIYYIKNEIGEIKVQVFNHLPHLIDELNKDFQNFKLKNVKWLIGILISVILLLIGTLLNFIK